MNGTGLEDKKFYDIWEQEDQPYDSGQGKVLEHSAELSKAYPINKKVYIVRGYETFVVNSNDIDVSLDSNTGLRNITIKGAKMVKYTASGEKKE